MPCLNEAETLGFASKKPAPASPTTVSPGDIIADNGSTDGSQSMPRLGGRASFGEVKATAAPEGGIAAAGGRFVIMADADDSYDFSALMPFIEKLRAGCDFVMVTGSKEACARGHAAAHRYLGNPVLRAWVDFFSSARARGLTCGLRGFSRDAFERMKLQTTGWSSLARWLSRRRFLASNCRGTDDALAGWPQPAAAPAELARRLAALAVYAAIQSALAVFISGTLADAPGLGVGGLAVARGAAAWRGEARVHTLAYAALSVLLGFQAVLFSLFTRTFAITRGPLCRQVAC
ncbi:MAG: hypothetical protein CM1200mP29_03450 [Verrucomicrobiota bacterium]|nr:MAG: hypothetical protein CM1200mP29_03450 [Verrucomicrobiota bacterium]